jgi:hypothetical protein
MTEATKGHASPNNRRMPAALRSHIRKRLAALAFARPGAPVIQLARLGLLGLREELRSCGGPLNKDGSTVSIYQMKRVLDEMRREIRSAAPRLRIERLSEPSGHVPRRPTNMELLLARSVQRYASQKTAAALFFNELNRSLPNTAEFLKCLRARRAAIGPSGLGKSLVPVVYEVDCTAVGCPPVPTVTVADRDAFADAAMRALRVSTLKLTRFSDQATEADPTSDEGPVAA